MLGVQPMTPSGSGISEGTVLWKARGITGTEWLGAQAARRNQILRRGWIEIHLQLSKGSAAAFPPRLASLHKAGSAIDGYVVIPRGSTYRLPRER